jgi:hypothetical protein
LVTVVLHFPEQAALLLGAQHVPPLMQTSPEVEHADVPPTPQKTV